MCAPSHMHSLSLSWCCDKLQAFWALSLVAKAMFTMRAIIQDSSKAKSAAALVFAILDRKSKIDPNDETGLTLEDVNGEIKLINVNFSYPTRPGVQVLTDLSFTIQSGKVLHFPLVVVPKFTTLHAFIN